MQTGKLTAFFHTKAGFMVADLLAGDDRPCTLFEADASERQRQMGVLDTLDGSDAFAGVQI